jgi:c(7)-type cytochrome triheme protein
MRRFLVHRLLFLFSVLVVVAGVVLPSPTEAEYGDITLNRYAEEAGVPPVVFPHWFHRIRFKCKVCHSDIFEMRAGANDITMIKIIKGQYCGKCHNGKVAWAPLYCDRCHSGQSEVTIPPARGFAK